MVWKGVEYDDPVPEPTPKPKPAPNQRYTLVWGLGNTTTGLRRDTSSDRVIGDGRTHGGTSAPFTSARPPSFLSGCLITWR